MENANVTGKKDRILICGLACIFLVIKSFSVVFAELPSFPDDFKVSEYFSFFGSGGIDWQALQDPNNNPILVACLKGIADESLKPPGILDVKRRLESLERGNLVKKVDGRYVLAFPAVVGEKRDRLREYAEQAARQLVPSTEKIIAQIRRHLAQRDEMLYHVLWSVVMDGGQAWDAARDQMNEKITTGDTSIQNKAWLLYPSHPFRVGTNSWSRSFGCLQVTWSRNTPSPNDIGRVIAQYATQLIQAIERDQAVESTDANDALSKYGLVDEAGNVRFYVTQLDSEAARSYAELGTQFGRQMMTHLDVKKVAEMLEVSPGIAFVIAYHEICWQLLQDLAEKKVLSIPQIVAQSGTMENEAYQLVSLTISQTVKDPLPDTEISTEEARAIEEYRRIKAQILAGESYDDSSTPLHAVLTRFSSWEPQDRGYFMGLDILRAPLPPAKPEEGSLWPVFAGDTELADTFILVYAKGRWIWIGNVGTNIDWRLGKSTFEKWARQKIGQSIPSDDSGNTPSADARAPEESAGNRVLSLDGEGDFVQIANSQSLNSFSDAITIEVWFKVSSFYAEKGMVNSLIRKNIKAGVENFFIRFRNVAGVPSVEMSVGYDIPVLKAPYEFGVDTWYHLAGTYNGSVITVFVNGVSIKSEKASGPMYIDNSDLFIGKGDPEFSFGEFFHGALDELRIWNVARSPEEIRAAMNSPLTGKEDGLVVYLNFDDGTAKDLSGHGNDGVLSESARIVESPHPASVQKEQPNMLLAWWRLDEADGKDVADSSGNACGGKLVGNPQWRSAAGKVGGALEFDGDGDYVRIDDESAFDIAGPVTIAAWFKVNTFDKRWQALITKGDTSWRLQRSAEDNTLAFHCTGITSVTSQRPEGIEGKKNVNDGQWHHVVGVYDGSEILLYIDGVLDNSSKASGEIRMNDSAVIIGDNSEQSGREWNGLIDEVCIIAGAIDANAINALYTNSDPVTIAKTANPQLQGPDKLVAWWKFEDDVNDSAGDNHGIINGNPTYADGKVGRAINLDGDDYVDCGNASVLNFGTGDWTLSAWIKTTQTGTNQDEEQMNRGTVFANGGDEAGGIRYAIAVNEGQLGCITLTTDDDAHKTQAIGKTAVNDGAWHHVVGVRNADKLHVYVDGKLDGTAFIAAGYDLSGVSQHNAYIGAVTDNRDNSLYKYFVGLIDEVCILACALDANSVSALYSGKDPMTVAEQVKVVTGPPSRTRLAIDDDTAKKIVGDWDATLEKLNRSFVITITRNTDGSLAANAFFEGPDDELSTLTFDEVTFANGRLRLEARSIQAFFEGTINEEGSTIEGPWQQQGQALSLVLKRAVKVQETEQTVQGQSQDQISSKSNIVTALILVLALAGVVGGIIFFLVKSSIRK